MERKVKYDYAFKLECVELVLKKHYSNRYVSKLKGLDESNIRNWLSSYINHGEFGLLRRKNQSYSVDFKLKVLKTIKKETLHSVNAEGVPVLNSPPDWPFMMSNLNTTQITSGIL